jgi:FixJ family two-component response regulator
MLTLEGQVVLVDDDSSIRGAVGRMLRAHRYTPSIFVSAEQLLETHTKIDAACLILDVQLPGITGFELYDCVARMGNAPPVIFITGYEEPNTWPRAEAAGAAAYFVKPFPGRDLVAATARAIEVRRAPPARR